MRGKPRQYGVTEINKREFLRGGQGEDSEKSGLWSKGGDEKKGYR